MGKSVQPEYTPNAAGVSREIIAATVSNRSVETCFEHSEVDHTGPSPVVTSELAFGQTVTVKVRDTDRYRRLVAEVMLPEGRSLNHELVAAGLAWWAFIQSTCKYRSQFATH